MSKETFLLDLDKSNPEAIFKHMQTKGYKVEVESDGTVYIVLENVHVNFGEQFTGVVVDE